SKSGGTVETNNGLLEAKQAYAGQGLEFSGYSVAITQEGSKLDKIALSEGWLARFPMWDWVGGRTSVTSAVGLLPAALQGIDIDSFLQGAAACDQATRKAKLAENPAAQMAAMWWIATGGKGGTDLVILPYKDRLQLLAKYLQQLIMESLGKEKDLDGQLVNQGLAVFGNKGSTDQHSYVQQLLDGPPNVLVTFVEVLRDRSVSSIQVQEDITSGDYLIAFLQGTRRALTERGRNSITITIPEVSYYSLGVLIALFERTVGLYAQMINVNAYHQPAVEYGKKGANLVVTLQRQVLAYLRSKAGQAFSCEEIAAAIGQEEETELIFKILEHAAHNPDHRVKRHLVEPIYLSKYSISSK
ncbi:MAG: glucose-6-phosphate isomerase, partial [Peptococcia bacterium]